MTEQERRTAEEMALEVKRLAEQLTQYYTKTARWMDREKVAESVDKLVNPLDNAINEKCSRIKKAFMDLMDEYRASYYIIGSHTKKHIGGRVWYERLKVITLPRGLVELRIKSSWQSQAARPSEEFRIKSYCLQQLRIDN